jgi:hypothetical protein
MLSVKTWGIETRVEELYFPRDVIGFLVPGLCMVHDNVFDRIQLRAVECIITLSELISIKGYFTLSTVWPVKTGVWGDPGRRKTSTCVVVCNKARGPKV